AGGRGTRLSGRRTGRSRAVRGRPPPTRPGVGPPGGARAPDTAAAGRERGRGDGRGRPRGGRPLTAPRVGALPVGPVRVHCYDRDGRARRGTSGALYPQSALAGLNARPRIGPMGTATARRR